MCEPVTYFGETDWQRFRRLFQLEQMRKNDVDNDVDKEGD